MTYIGIYKILRFQNKLIDICENAIHFCKNIQENAHYIGNYINRRFNSQKLKTGNLNIKIQISYNSKVNNNFNIKYYTKIIILNQNWNL